MEKSGTWSLGRYGNAETMFVYKIAGAKVEAGAEIGEVKRMAEKAAANVRSLGIRFDASGASTSEPRFVLVDN